MNFDTLGSCSENLLSSGDSCASYVSLDYTFWISQLVLEKNNTIQINTIPQRGGE